MAFLSKIRFKKYFILPAIYLATQILLVVSLSLGNETLMGVFLIIPNFIPLSIVSLLVEYGLTQSELFSPLVNASADVYYYFFPSHACSQNNPIYCDSPSPAEVNLYLLFAAIFCLTFNIMIFAGLNALIYRLIAKKDLK